MSRPFSLRHSGLSDRQPAAQEAELSNDQVNQLATTIIDKASDYILQKEEARLGPKEEGYDISAAVNSDPEAMANKMIKEAAREMARDEGKHHHPVHSGSAASWAQRVKAKKKDPESLEHQVAERVKEKLEVSRDREGAGHHMFVGPAMNSTSIEHGRGG
ncbi:hypothetical protein N2152v2_007117 [Parachlorella kessleri]